MPSLIDSWGLVTIEALRFGTPIIGFPAPGTVEIFGKATRQIGLLSQEKTEIFQFLMKTAQNREIWEQYSQGAFEESLNYAPEKLALLLLEKLWSREQSLRLKT
jgi:glycosyltransferase involved in cell wall biosynthesis